jgi:hypothetical protein
MKNNGVIAIEATNMLSLRDMVRRVPDMFEGIVYMEKVFEGFPKDILGGVGYDDKAIYAYVIDPEPLEGMTIMKQAIHAGVFLRYDDIRGFLVARPMIYIKNCKTHLIFDRISEKVVIKNLKDSWKARDLLKSLREGCSLPDSKVSLIFDKILDAINVEFTEDEAMEWLLRAFHNFKHSDIIRAMFTGRKKSAWGLYIAIAKYYSKRSITPHMQWWYIVAAEKLVMDPSMELQKIRAFKKIVPSGQKLLA